MHTVALTPHLTATTNEVERSECAAIAGEIALRLLDMRQASSGTRTISFIQKLHAIHLCTPSGFWIILRLMSGDLNEITKTYDQLGKETGRSRQAVEQEMDRVIKTLDEHFPDVSHAIYHLRNRHREINKESFNDEHGSG